MVDKWTVETNRRSCWQGSINESMLRIPRIQFIKFISYQMLYHFSKNKALFNVQSWEFVSAGPNKHAQSGCQSLILVLKPPFRSLFDRVSYSRTRSNKTYKAQDNQIPTAKLRRHPLICSASAKQCVMCTSECIYTYRGLNKSDYVQFEQESKAGSQLNEDAETAPCLPLA